MEHLAQAEASFEHAVYGLTPSKRKAECDPDSPQIYKQNAAFRDSQKSETSLRPLHFSNDRECDPGLESSDDEANFVDAQEKLPSSYMAFDDDFSKDSFTKALYPMSGDGDIEGDRTFSSESHRQEPLPDLSFSEYAELELSQTPEAENSIKEDNSIVVDQSNNENEDNNGDQDSDGDGDDLFAATFGKDSIEKHSEPEDSAANDSDDSELQIISVKKKPTIPRESPSSLSLPSPKQPQAPAPAPENLFLKTLHAHGYDFVVCEHNEGCRDCDPIRRLSTPPSPPPQRSAYQPAAYPNFPQAQPLAFRSHQRFHAKVEKLIPWQQARSNFDPARRYWIAVLLQGKEARKANSARDYVWMKGSRCSTVATVWHSYQTTTMADPDELALRLGRDSVAMRDQMQQLDYFDDRLIVFRAVREPGSGAGGGRLAAVLGAPTVIEVDD